MEVRGEEKNGRKVGAQQGVIKQAHVWRCVQLFEAFQPTGRSEVVPAVRNVLVMFVGGAMDKWPWVSPCFSRAAACMPGKVV